MLLPIIKQFNWIDILVIILFVRICYIGVKTGFPTELFKLLGTLLSVYLALHYFTVVSDFLVQRFRVKDTMPLEFLDFLMFVLLSCIGYAVFLVLRLVFARWMKMEAVPKLNQWGGFFVSIARGALVSGLVVFTMEICTISYVRDSVRHSYAGERVFTIAPATYSWIWNHCMSKFMIQDKFNQTVSETQQKFSE